MATRRCLQTLTRNYPSFLSPNPSLQSLKRVNHRLQQSLNVPHYLSPQILTPKFRHISTNTCSCCCSQLRIARHFSSDQRNDSGDDEETESESDDDVEESVSGSNSDDQREYTSEEREEEVAAIGYEVIGPLRPSDKVFKPYEPVYAVVQIGSHQFKVSNGDSIFTERLKFCEVNDKLILNKVLMLGSKTSTIIGRPILPDAAVHAVVEEHALDAKVIIFKKKRRKNYRRTKGHRQELTKLRITDIQGIEKPDNTLSGKTEQVAVAA